MASLPLAVDLDGTLIAGDVTAMSFFALLRRNPFVAVALLPLYVLNNPRYKFELAQRIDIDPSTLTYNEALLTYVRSERAGGRKIALATAANEKIAKRVANHLGCFDEIIASDKTTLRGGKGKADGLTAKFGPKGFVYAGNEMRDLPVWDAAAAAILVSVPLSLKQLAEKRYEIERVF